MNEVKFFYSDTNLLLGICTFPDSKEIKAGLVFVHAADGNRLGPHRMFVEFAEKLKHVGIASFRFDMRGCGDSDGKPAGNDISSDVEDLQNAIDFFATNYNLQRIFLIGISRGARVIVSALAENRLEVDGAILLSTPFSGSKVAVKNFSGRFKEYLYKLTNYASLRKLFTGRANLIQIAKTLFFALSSPKRYRHKNDKFKTICLFFFIYGSKDPIATDSSLYYRKICEKFNIPFKMEHIKNANHSFFHYCWKEQIMEMTENWLTENINGK